MGAPSPPPTPGNEPLVSVVMPFFDAGSHFRESIESVLAQSWTPLELVLVDDGGTDGSEALAREYAARDPERIRVVAHEGRRNRGIGPSRAFGISQAGGEIVAFLDADDVWEPDHVADDVRLLLDHPEVDLVCGRVFEWRSWADPVARDKLTKLAFPPGSVVPPPRLLAAVLRNGGFATSPCGVMARRPALLGCLDDLAKFPGMYEDQAMNSYLQLRVATVMSGATSTWYRKHATSFSARDDVRPALPDGGRTAWLTWLRDHLGTSGVVDPEVQTLVEEGLRASLDRAQQPSVPPEEQPRIAASARSLLPGAVRRRVRSLRRRLAPPAPVPASVTAQRLERLLFRYGADVRGDVLVIGAAPPQGVCAGGTSLAVRAWPEPVPTTGPDHGLTVLPSRAYDCILALWEATAAPSGDLGFRHLRRALRPGGTLLVVVPERLSPLETAVREVFAWHEVRDDNQIHPGPPDRPMILLRAAVPVP
jgi:hypothetical protein